MKWTIEHESQCITYLRMYVSIYTRMQVYSIRIQSRSCSLFRRRTGADCRRITYDPVYYSFPNLRLVTERHFEQKR